jgi:hypothetical protein
MPVYRWSIRHYLGFCITDGPFGSSADVENTWLPKPHPYKVLNLLHHHFVEWWIGQVPEDYPRVFMAPLVDG